MSDTLLAGEGTKPAEGAKPAEGQPAEGPLQPWLGQGADDQKRNEYLGSFKSIPEANKAHIELHEKSKGMVKIPDVNSTEEERKAFYKANGVPDTPEGYELATPDIPEGMKMDDETAKWFREISHKLGLNKHQANTLFAEESKRRVQSHNVTLDAVKKGKEGIMQKWGVDYDANLEIANRAVTKFGSAEFPEFLTKSGLGNHPAMLEYCLAVGKAIAEDKTVVGVGPGGENIAERKYPNSPEMYEKK